MTNKQIFKHIRALAHEECANCHAGNCALTDERCHIINTNYQSVQDALAVSIGERARVDLGYMAQLTGKSEEDIVQELTGVIFRIPGTEAQYVTADEYLSGNVRQKLRDARTAAQSDAAFQPNVKALEAAQPKDLEASDIDVRLGATWIAPEYIQDFMYELLNTPYYQRRAIEVHFSPHTAEWRINGKTVVSRSNVAAYTTYGTDKIRAISINL